MVIEKDDHFFCGEQSSKSEEQRGQRAQSIVNLRKLGNLVKLGRALPTFILKLLTLPKLIKLPKLPNNFLSNQHYQFLVKRGEMWTIAKMPSMGCTWRTAHWRHFFGIVRRLPLFTRNNPFSQKKWRPIKWFFQPRPRAPLVGLVAKLALKI